MDQGRKVWAPDVKEGFILGEISDFGADTLSVQPLDGGKVRNERGGLHSLLARVLSL